MGEGIKLSEYRLHINPGEEGCIPKGSLEIDVRYFDLDSLVRLYGREAVLRYINGQRVVKGVK